MCDIENKGDIEVTDSMQQFTCIDCRNSYDEAAKVWRTKIAWKDRKWE